MPVQLDHGQRVTNDYFSGAPPFTNAKQRSDIPDSFIWQTIVDLTENGAKVYIIVADVRSTNRQAKTLAWRRSKPLEDFVQTRSVNKHLKNCQMRPSRQT